MIDWFTDWLTDWPRLTKLTNWPRYLVCSLNYKLQMRFAPQRCAIFRRPNFQKKVRYHQFLSILFTPLRCATSWHSTFKSGPNIVFCTFWFCAPTALASLLFDPPDKQDFAIFLTFLALVDSFFWLSRAPVFSFFWLSSTDLKLSSTK